MYDDHGCISSYDKNAGRPEVGDSCFWMGLQALIFCFLGEITGEYIWWHKARVLWGTCLEMGFCRHPLLVSSYNATSFDMMVVWDYIISRWPHNPAGAWWRPSYERRNSKYWSGRHRGPWMFWPATVIPQLLFRLIFPATMRDCYKSNLLMLTAGVVYENTENAAVLWLMKRYVQRLEKATGDWPGGRYFFRWLSYERQLGEPIYLWGSGHVGWQEQRDRRLLEEYKRVFGHLEFHTEDLPKAPASTISTTLRSAGGRLALAMIGAVSRIPRLYEGKDLCLYDQFAYCLLLNTIYQPAIACFEPRQRA